MTIGGALPVLRVPLDTYNLPGSSGFSAGPVPESGFAGQLELLLAGMAFAALAAGTTGGYLPGGALALLRNLAGLTGTGLLAAAALGGAFGWVGPMAYLLVTEVALTGHPATPWLWPARPPHDLGGAVCAGLVLAVGSVLMTMCGARESARD